MYFLVIMAFAFVLSDELPPERLNLFKAPSGQFAVGTPLLGSLAVVAAQLVLVTLAALISRRLTVARLTGPGRDYDRAMNTFSVWQRVLLVVIALGTTATMVLTPWARVVRQGWGLGGLPLVDDCIIIAPFIISLLIIWIFQFPAESRIRTAFAGLDEEDVADPPPSSQVAATAALAAAKHRAANPTGSLRTYIVDKLRHQFLIIAVPMTVIVFAKHFMDIYREGISNALGVPWAADSLLGCVSVCVLAFAPVMLRYIWSTEPLPDGPLRDKLVRICDRIGMRYREILLWHTHGMAVNAAVMGFVGPMRYILVSDALLETMGDEEIEAVFGHEAGHVRHHHLQFFLVFVVLTMYVSGGVLELLIRNQLVTDRGNMQIIALGVLLVSWLFGFGWISRQFERQADLFGVRCVTPDIRTCVDRCPIHGQEASPGICTGAASLFGRTLARIADLNGIPRDAPSWRHGTIQSRCDLLERFTADTGTVRKFDRRLVVIKFGLISATLIGTVIAELLYHDQIAEAIRRLLSG